MTDPNIPPVPGRGLEEVVRKTKKDEVDHGGRAAPDERWLGNDEPGIHSLEDDTIPLPGPDVEADETT